MVPKGWSQKKLGGLVIKVGSGITPKGGSNSYQKSGIPLIRSQNVLWGCLDLSDVAYIDSKQHQKMSGSKVIENDVLLNITGASIGRVAIATNIVEANVNQHVCIIRANEQLYPGFLKEFLLSFYGQKQIEQFQAGGNRQGLNFEQVRSFKILLPLLSEQKKISKILSTWDKAITTTEQLLANSQQQKKALMQQLLTGKRRFSGFIENWIHGRLGDLCIFKGGSAFKEIFQGSRSGDLPFIKVSDMNINGNEIFICKANNWLSFEVAQQMKVKPFPAGVIVFAKVGAALLLNRRRILSRDTIIDNNMMAAIPENISDSIFLYYILLAIDFAKFVQDGAVPSINQGDLSNFKISYPAHEEQRKISSALSIADRELETLQKKLNYLKQEKKALMQELLTGKRRTGTNI